MGINISSLYAHPPEKPKTVLVPPLFERDLKARSRMVKSSYDYLFGKPSLRWLFKDYFAHGLSSVLYFAPSADPRISVKATLGTQDPGSLSIRYQPYGALEPQCFTDIKANPKVAGDVRLRACAFSTANGMGAFATFPLAKEVSGQRAEVGVRFSSPEFTAGLMVQPAMNILSRLWVAGKYEGVTAGIQLLPGLLLHDLSGSFQAALASSARDLQLEGAAAAVGSGLEAKLAGGAGAASAGQRGELGQWLRDVSSVAVAYSPPGRTRAGQPAFTASLELQHGQRFLVSFFQHMAAIRQVFNPLEKDDVIGITNFIDVGLQLEVPLVTQPGQAPPTTGLRLGGSWQVNKNVLLKGKLGSDAISLLVAFKTWFNPSMALAAAADYSFNTKKMRYGITVQVENFGAMRYERSREALVHGRVLTQRHEATNAELAMAEGDRPLVRKDARDDVFNAPEATSTTYL